MSIFVWEPRFVAKTFLFVLVLDVYFDAEWQSKRIFTFIKSFAKGYKVSTEIIVIRWHESDEKAKRPWCRERRGKKYGEKQKEEAEKKNELERSQSVSPFTKIPFVSADKSNKTYVFAWIFMATVWYIYWLRYRYWWRKNIRPKTKSCEKLFLLSLWARDGKRRAIEVFMCRCDLCVCVCVRWVWFLGMKQYFTDIALLIVLGW